MQARGELQPRSAARSRVRTSAVTHQRSMCILLKSSCAEGRVNSLKPHCGGQEGLSRTRNGGNTRRDCSPRPHLGVANASHAEKGHGKVKAVHENRAEEGALGHGIVLQVGPGANHNAVVVVALERKGAKGRGDRRWV